MTRLMKLVLFGAVLALLVAPFPAQAQTPPVRTTLSTAMVAPAAGNTLTVASVTGINASSGTIGQQNCLIDQEMVRIRSIASTTLTVQRVIQGLGTAHVSGATVICGAVGTFNSATGSISSQVGSPTVGGGVTGATFVGSLPVGSCTRSQNAILPVFFITASPVGAGGSYGYAVDCLAGKWTPGTLADYPPPTPLVLATNVGVGQVAYASVGTNTTDIATVEWLTSIVVPKSGWVTGIRFLCGSTCTTDKGLAILRDMNGVVIANAAVAGLLVTGANTFQTQAFTVPRFIVGPATYFVGIQGNGTAAGFIETQAASTFVDTVTGQLTSGTFGTIVNPATMPVTFTAGQGPVVEIFY